MKSLQQGQLPGWICQCQVGIQGFGAVPRGVMDQSATGEGECWTAQHRDHHWPTWNCSRGWTFQCCSNSMAGTSPSLWGAAVESLPSLDHPLLCVPYTGEGLGYLCRWGGGTAGAAVMPWVWSLLQQGPFPARGDPAWWSHQEQESWVCSHELVLIQSRKSKCQFCEMQKKKKALASWDKAFCSRAKANEVISVTQDLVRTFCIYGECSVLSRYSPVAQMPPSSCKCIKCIPCSLCVNCKPSAAGQWGAATGFPSSSPHSQQLQGICWPLSVKTCK